MLPKEYCDPTDPTDPADPAETVGLRFVHPTYGSRSLNQLAMTPGLHPSKTDEKILLFTRYPAPGRAKTRLVPALGAQGAAALQRRLTEQTVARIKALQGRRPVGLEIRYTGGSRERFAAWLAGAELAAQGRGDLGARLRRAFAAAFARGAKGVLAVGADCPALSPEILTQAFEELRRRDLVLGPAEDGGYYLLGLSRPAPALFAAVPWGTSAVLAATLARAAAGGLSLALLEPLADVDRPEDLAHLDATAHGDKKMG